MRGLPAAALALALSASLPSCISVHRFGSIPEGVASSASGGPRAAGTLVLPRDRGPLTRALERSGTFERVVSDDDDSGGARWIVTRAEEHGTRQPDMTRFMICALTLGIVPYVSTGDLSVDLELQRLGTAETVRRAVRFTVPDGEVGGWIAIPLLALPSWGSEEAADRRLAEILAVELAKAGVGAPAE